MQAAPAVSVSVGRSAATLVALAGLIGLAVGCCAAWAVQRADLLGGSTLAGMVGAGAGLLHFEGHRPVRQLQWDGERWWLGAAQAASPRLPGQLAVAIDLDVWLLLRFRTEPAAGRPRNHWLALQRADHRLDWHALRCAVHSPRSRQSAQD